MNNEQLEKMGLKNRIQIINLEMERDKLKHEFKIQELQLEQQNILKFHDLECQRMRIKTAEIKKSQERQEWIKFNREEILRGKNDRFKDEVKE